MEKRTYSFLGIAQKAGKLLLGESACEKGISKGIVSITIVAQDASDNTKKKFNNACIYRNIPIRLFGEKEKLGKVTGKVITAVICVTDSGFAQKIDQMIQSSYLNLGVE